MENRPVIPIVDRINQCPNSEKNTEKFQNFENESTRYQQDCHQFLNLLPKEVWDYICSFLDSKDFFNFNNSSLFIRDLFLRKRVLFLYKPVLEILLPQLKLYMKAHTTNYPQNICTTLCYFRQVCKMWKRTIDKQASSMDKNFIQDHLFKNYSFSDTQKIDQFLQHFSSTHPTNVNPSPGKYIELRLRPMLPDYLLFLDQIPLLLAKYGQHICTLDLSEMFGFVMPPEIYRRILEWLQCMPNLQNLRIFYFIPMRSEIVAQAQLVTLPVKLNSLRKLSIQTTCPRETRPNEQIPNWSWLERYNLNQLIYSHENLNYLKTMIFNKLDAEIFKKVKSPLKTLVVFFHCKEENIKLADVFNLMSENFFSNSLENLTITFRFNSFLSGHLQCMLDSLNCRLNLPNVRKFEINTINLFCLDFLLGIKESLEELLIHCVDGKQGRCMCRDFCLTEKLDIENLARKQIISFVGYQGNMLESNIWTLFPKLQTFRLVQVKDRLRYKVTRKDWLKLQKNS